MCHTDVNCFEWIGQQQYNVYNMESIFAFYVSSTYVMTMITILYV